MDANAPIDSQASSSLMDSIKNMDPQGVMDSVNDTVQGYGLSWTDIATSFGIGCLSGFLFKRYFHLFLMTLLTGFGFLLIMQHFGFATVNWSGLEGMLGLSQAQSIGDVFTSLFIWVEANVTIFVSFLVGFITGHKIG